MNFILENIHVLKMYYLKCHKFTRKNMYIYEKNGQFASFKVIDI